MKKKFVTVSMSAFLMCFIFLGLLTGGCAEQKESEGKVTNLRDDIVKLMKLTNAGDMGVQMMKQMIPVLKQSHPGVPDKFWNSFMAEIDPNGLAELIVPVYEKHFTHEEIKALISFYESPVGKKILEKQPLIMQESMVLGQEWGRELGMKVMRDLKKEGY